MTSKSRTPAAPRGRRQTAVACPPGAGSIDAGQAATLPLTAPSTATAASKSGTVIKLLLRAKGATAMELIAATDWQAHSVRALLSGLCTKRRIKS